MTEQQVAEGLLELCKCIISYEEGSNYKDALFYREAAIEQIRSAFNTSRELELSDDRS